MLEELIRKILLIFLPWYPYLAISYWYWLQEFRSNKILKKRINNKTICFVVDPLLQKANSLELLKWDD